MGTNINTNDGKNVMLNRAYKAVPDYTVPSKFKVGIKNGTPVVTDTDLDYAVPIADGTTSDDGSNTMTGSSGGDNSTDNTTTFKAGGGNTDVTAQNLIANNTNATKIWTIADLTVAGVVVTATEPYAIWFYIVDATALAKFVSAGTALSIKFRTNGDGATLYYEDAYEDGALAVGWNWITSNTVLVNALTQGGGGPPSGVLDEFVITITTNNATDTFVAGDVVYDLLRTWATTDLTQTFVTGWPTFDEVNKRVTIRGFLGSTLANGFPINSNALFNTDATNKMTDADEFDIESKEDTDEFALIWTNQLL